MYAIERKKIIREYLKEHNQVQVQELSRILDVSEVTVRRDLEFLEKEGLLTRTHGGAILNGSSEQHELFTLFEPVEDKANYDKIATAALKFINDGDVIMLTNGETNAIIASRLEERKGVKVLTNDVTIALKIALQQQNHVVLLGGDLHKTDIALYGSMTLMNLEKFFVHHLFVEIDGINSSLQATVTSQEKADLILKAMNVCENVTFICPSKRFNTSAFFLLGKVTMSKRIITDKDVSDEYKEKIFSNNVALFTSAAPFEGNA